MCFWRYRHVSETAYNHWCLSKLPVASDIPPLLDAVYSRTSDRSGMRRLWYSLVSILKNTITDHYARFIQMRIGEK